MSSRSKYSGSGSSADRRKARRWARKVILRERDAGVQLTLNFREAIEAVIGQYADYLSFSDTALETAIGSEIELLAEEMAYKMSQSINAMLVSTPLLYVYADGSVGYTPFPPNAPSTPPAV